MTTYDYIRRHCWLPPDDLVAHWWANCAQSVLGCRWCFLGEKQEAPFDWYAGRVFIPAEGPAEPGDFGL